MKKLIPGRVQYAAGRAFIPVIEEFAESVDSGGLFVAHLFSLIVVDPEGDSVHPFENSLTLADLLSRVPDLVRILEHARLSL